MEAEIRETITDLESRVESADGPVYTLPLYVQLSSKYLDLHSLTSPLSESTALEGFRRSYRHARDCVTALRHIAEIDGTQGSIQAYLRPHEEAIGQLQLRHCASRAKIMSHKARKTAGTGAKISLGLAIYGLARLLKR